MLGSILAGNARGLHSELQDTTRSNNGIQEGAHFFHSAIFDENNRGSADHYPLISWLVKRQKNSKESTSGIEETAPFAELNVVMRSKFLDKIDDLSTDAEASDINSQAEFSSIAVPRVNKHKSKDATNALDPGWTDPWSSEPWKNGKWPETSNNNQSRIDTSFDSLQFTPVIKTSGENTSSELFGFVDAFGAPFSSTDIPAVATNNAGNRSTKRDTKSKSPPNALKESKINVGVVVKERLSILYDEATNEPSCKVTGDIYVKPTNRKLNSFALTVRDSRDNVEDWDERNRRCRNVTAAVPHLALDPSDQVFSISMKRDHQNELGLENPVVSYSCIPRLRPMPLVRTLLILQRRKIYARTKYLTSLFVNYPIFSISTTGQFL